MPLKCETHLLQDAVEFNRFLTFIREQQVRSYLEIGSKNGGSFWRISNALPRGSKVVSVDLPHGDTSFKETEQHLKACVDELVRRGYKATLVIGDSTDEKIVERVRKMSPFDLIFIDANHTETYVWRDWENYGPMGKLVAFHDIGHIMLPHKPTNKLPIEVGKVWKQLRREHEHLEIRNCAASNGIGILWKSQSAS